MMTLTAYLSRVVATRIAAVLGALSALVLLIEMLEAIRRVLGTSRGIGTVLTYLALRIPLAVDRLLPLAILIGCSVAFSTLARSNEMSILRAAGLSPLRFLRFLLPVIVICGAVNYLLQDSLAPATEQAFATWWQGIATDQDDDSKKSDTQWLHIGGQIVSIGRISDNGRRLDDINRYSRDSMGRLTLVAHAKSATFSDGAWRLEGESVTGSDGRPLPTTGVWENGPEVENMRLLTLPMERVSGSHARQVLQGEWTGKGGKAHYRIILHRSYVALVIPLVMLLLAVPSLHGERRAGNLARGVATSLGLGLAFLVINGLFLSMGEAGAIPPMLAAWAAPLSFSLLGIGMLLHFEE